MSRRYGRNQRRKAREELAAAQLVADRWKRKAKIEEDRYYDIQTQLHNCRLVLGDDHVCFTPQDLNIGFNPLSGPIALDMLDVPVNFEFPHMPADLIRGDAAWKPHRREMHFKVSYRGEVYGYAVTHEAMLRIPADILIRNASRELAKALVHRYDEERKKAEHERN